MAIDLDALKGLDLPELAETLEALLTHRAENRAEFFVPYPKQLEFIALGKVKDERLFMKANQVGGTEAGAWEMACHATGLYPKGWPGRVWRRPTTLWEAGINVETVRDVQQAKLCGTPGVPADAGTGFIPKHCLLGSSRQPGAVANAFDSLQVQHHTDGRPDGTSIIQFKSYSQGKIAFQGRTIDAVRWDEEPEDVGVYSEGNSRWNATGGMSWMTFTPWHGYTDIVNRFLLHENEHRGYVKMSAFDCPHMTPAMIESMKSKYPPHEWAARIYGDPAMGAGQVFTRPRAEISFPSDMPIQPYWGLIWGIDFGSGGELSHPFAAVLLACDRETDRDYVVATYRIKGGDPMAHSEAMRRICADAPVAWPHDGNIGQRDGGGDMKPIYKQFDLNMLPSHAHYPGGGYSTEAAVLDLQQAFKLAGGPGGLQVREDLSDFWEEYRVYRRELTRTGNSVLVKKGDDILSALMKARMMRRYAKPVGMGYRPRVNRAERVFVSTGPALNPWTGEPLDGL